MKTWLPSEGKYLSLTAADAQENIEYGVAPSAPTPPLASGSEDLALVSLFPIFIIFLWEAKSKRSQSKTIYFLR